jgi:transposase
MSSNSLLYHGFGLEGVDYLKTEYKGGSIYFHIKTKDSNLVCSNCGSNQVNKKGKVERQFQTYSIGPKPVYLMAHIQRLFCKECKKVLQEEIKFADKKNLIQEG